MKITIRIPTTQFAYLEAEGDEKDLPKMIELHNKYCVQKIDVKEHKKREPNKFKGISEQGRGF